MGKIIDIRKFMHIENNPEPAMESIEDDDYEPTMDDMGDMQYDKRVCSFCDDSFEEDLKWTDGGGYYCEECATTLKQQPFYFDKTIGQRKT